jgi:sugar fermentation stimulation protein A
MRLPANLVPGIFVRRRNRFAADVVVDGEPCLAHVPNSGRMAELLVQGAAVLLARAPAASARRTAYSLTLVRHQGRGVGVDSRLPPALVVEAWRQGLLPLPGAYDRVQREVRLGRSRLDLRFDGPDGCCYVEAKSVTLVVDGVALFPDAPTARGAKHLGELADAVSLGHGAAVVFVVQRDDAEAMAPHAAADPRFAEALRRAAVQGVGVYAIACKVTRRSMVPIRGLQVRLGRQASASVGTP